VGCKIDLLFTPSALDNLSPAGRCGWPFGALGGRTLVQDTSSSRRRAAAPALPRAQPNDELAALR